MGNISLAMIGEEFRSLAWKYDHLLSYIQNLEQQISDRKSMESKLSEAKVELNETQEQMVVVAQRMKEL